MKHRPSSGLVRGAGGPASHNHWPRLFTLSTVACAPVAARLGRAGDNRGIRMCPSGAGAHRGPPRAVASLRVGARWAPPSARADARRKRARGGPYAGGIRADRSAPPSPSPLPRSVSGRACAGRPRREWGSARPTDRSSHGCGQGPARVEPLPAERQGRRPRAPPSRASASCAAFPRVVRDGPCHRRPGLHPRCPACPARQEPGPADRRFVALRRRVTARSWVSPAARGSGRSSDRAAAVPRRRIASCA